MTKKIVFVYNANSGAISALVDGLHKAFKPATYPCKLCTLSYGSVSMKKEWKSFVETLPYPVDFLHRDEFAERYEGVNESLPAVFLEDDDSLSPIVTAKELDAMTELKDLMKALSAATS